MSQADGELLTLVRRMGQVRYRLAEHEFRYRREVELHVAIGQVLDAAGITFEREVAVTGRNRFDFWIPAESLCIEVKVNGSIDAAVRQARRYAELPEVRGVIVAAAKYWAMPHHHTDPPSDLAGKPFAISYLRRPM